MTIYTTEIRRAGDPEWAYTLFDVQMTLANAQYLTGFLAGQGGQPAQLTWEAWENESRKGWQATAASGETYRITVWEREEKLG